MPHGNQRQTHAHHDHRHACGRMMFDRAGEGFEHQHARGEFRPDRGHGGGGRMGGGRLGRFFEHGDLRLVVLGLIAEKPRHGYEIIKAIEDNAGGAYSPSPGTIYPTLTMLEEQGYIAVTPSQDNKKSYVLTNEGTAFLEEHRSSVEALRARMASLHEARGNGPAPQIIRATENLKLALRLRLNQGPLSEEQIRRIAALLDQAAGEIERS